MAPAFNPAKYDPDKWLKGAKEAGFTYAVLTTRHHEGFAQWPSAYGNFNTKNFMGGRDLIKPYVEACRRNGLKVINPRLHGKGDFITYERRLTTDKVATGWAEFCNTWTNSWPHVDGARFRANGFILIGQ